MSNSNLDDCMDLTDPEEKAYYDGILGDDIIEPPEFGNVYACEPEVRYIGEDKTLVERKVDPELHWSERAKLGYSPSLWEPTDWYEQDNDARSPLEADLEDNEEPV